MSRLDVKNNHFTTVCAAGKSGGIHGADGMFIKRKLSKKRMICAILSVLFLLTLFFFAPGKTGENGEQGSNGHGEKNDTLTEQTTRKDSTIKETETAKKEENATESTKEEENKKNGQTGENGDDRKTTTDKEANKNQKEQKTDLQNQTVTQTEEYYEEQSFLYQEGVQNGVITSTQTIDETGQTPQENINEAQQVIILPEGVPVEEDTQNYEVTQGAPQDGSTYHGETFSLTWDETLQDWVGAWN